MRKPEQRQYFMPCSSASIVKFEQVNDSWEVKFLNNIFGK